MKPKPAAPLRLCGRITLWKERRPVKRLGEFRASAEGVRANFSANEVLVGMMLEVPAAVFAIPRFAPDVDFFSLVTDQPCLYFTGFSCSFAVPQSPPPTV